MTEARKKERLAQLERQWEENRKKIKRYKAYLDGLTQRQKEIEEEIKNL